MSGLKSALDASFAGRPIQTSEGLQIMTPYDIYNTFSQKYSVPPEMDKAFLQQLSAQQTTATQRANIAAPARPSGGIMESLMNALRLVKEHATGRAAGTISATAAGIGKADIALLKALIGHTEAHRKVRADQSTENKGAAGR